MTTTHASIRTLVVFGLGTVFGLIGAVMPSRAERDAVAGVVPTQWSELAATAVAGQDTGAARQRADLTTHQANQYLLQYISGRLIFAERDAYSRETRAWLIRCPKDPPVIGQLPPPCPPDVPPSLTVMRDLVRLLHNPRSGAAVDASKVQITIDRSLSPWTLPE